MSIKVANIEIFWSNGSYETPINFPDVSKFTTVANPNVVITSIDIGTAVLVGDWTYAFYKNNFYFLEKLETKDLDKKVFKYSMIRDLNYALFNCEDLVLEGELVKCTDKQTLTTNKQYIKGLDIQPIDIEFKKLSKSTDSRKINITETTYKPDEHAYIVTEDAWNVFDSQRTAIPDKGNKKPKSAILATLPTNQVENWKHILINEYLNPLISKLKNSPADFSLTKIDKYDVLNGRHQLTDDAPLLGNYLVPLDQLEKIDLSKLTDIVPHHKKDLVAYRNKKIDYTLDINKDKEAVRGYFEGVLFHPDDKPWENKSPTTPAQNFPLGRKDFGINNNLEFVQLDKSYDNTFKIHLEEASIEFLKSKKSDLDKIDEIVKRRLADWPSTAQGFHHYGGNVDAFRKYKQPTSNELTMHIKRASDLTLIPLIISAVGLSEFSLSDTYAMKKGLPRTKEGDYDYQKISEWISTGNFDKWNDGNIWDYTYHVMWGISELDLPYITSFRNEPDQLQFYHLIKGLHEEINATNDRVKKETFLRGVYKRLGYDVANDEFYFVTKKELSTEVHIFNLEGTNYFLTLQDGKASLIIKDINIDETKEYIDIYEGDISNPDIYQDINTKKILVTYNKETELPYNESIINNLKVKRLSPSNKLNIQDNILIDYSSKTTRIIDLFPIPLRSHEKRVVEKFDPVSYENYLLTYRKTKEELDLITQSRNIQRDRENYEFRYQQADLAIQYQERLLGGIGMLAGSAIGGLVKGAGIYGAVQKFRPVDFAAKHAIMERAGSQIIGVPAMAAMGARSVATTIQDLDKLNRQKANIEALNNYTIANRVVENIKLDNQHYWLDYDNRQMIQRASKALVATEYNSRDVIDEFVEMYKVDEIYVRLHKPNQDQIHMINEHYAQYGVDTFIPKFRLTWKDVKDKSNVWGFKYIKWVNIKDPVLKNFVYGKFINGVKLIKPTFN